MPEIRVEGQLVEKLEWKQTDGRTDATDRITFPASGVDPGGGRLPPPNKNIPGRMYLFALSKF